MLGVEGVFDIGFGAREEEYGGGEIDRGRLEERRLDLSWW